MIITVIDDMEKEKCWEMKEATQHISSSHAPKFKWKMKVIERPSFDQAFVHLKTIEFDFFSRGKNIYIKSP